MPGKHTEAGDRRDWRISAILAAIWFVALAIVVVVEIDIPASMMLIATVFFVLLIPAMNDLVRSIEKLSANRPNAVNQASDRRDQS